MDKDRLRHSLDTARLVWNNALPDFIRNLQPLPKDLFPDNAPLEMLLRKDQDQPIKRYFERLNLSSEEKDFIYRTVFYLAKPRVQGVFSDGEIAITDARKIVKGGMLEILDFFKDDPLMRETARRLLGLQR